MKTNLMQKSSGFDPDALLPWNADTLIQDLELSTLIDSMAAGDEFLAKVAEQALLVSLTDVQDIKYRQDILRDCLKRPEIVRQAYQIAVEALENKRKGWYFIFGDAPGSVLYASVGIMQVFAESLRKLRAMADEYEGSVSSEGLGGFFRTLRRELNDEYLAGADVCLKDLRFDDGALISASLGKGLEGHNYILRQPWRRRSKWYEKILGEREKTHKFYIASRDIAGARALSELKDRGLVLAANALAQAADHVTSFFNLLRVEMGFYVCCLNLHDDLSKRGVPLCFPVPTSCSDRTLRFVDIRDPSLALNTAGDVVGNDGDLDGKCLVVITGANQGGKSTFLRGLGLAQVMMQAGMFVTAQTYSGNVCGGIFTHYKREEDTEMSSGKHDEELERMSQIVSHLKAGSLVLLNESFAATNEREGSEIARQITSALRDKGVKTVFVTHLHDYARRICETGGDDVACLRAQRREDGSRPFKIEEGEPLQTSYGEDLYRRIFEKGRSVLH